MPRKKKTDQGELVSHGGLHQLNTELDSEHYALLEQFRREDMRTSSRSQATYILVQALRDRAKSQGIELPPFQGFSVKEDSSD